MKEDYIHCDNCGGCILKELKDTHKCIPDGLKGDCCICLESIFLSQEPVRLLACGHVIHGKCLEDLLKNNRISCPLCRKSLVEGEALKLLTRRIDSIIESNRVSRYLGTIIQWSNGGIIDIVTNRPLKMVILNK